MTCPFLFIMSSHSTALCFSIHTPQLWSVTWRWCNQTTHLLNDWLLVCHLCYAPLSREMTGCLWVGAYSSCAFVLFAFNTYSKHETVEHVFKIISLPSLTVFIMCFSIQKCYVFCLINSLATKIAMFFFLQIESSQLGAVWLQAAFWYLPRLLFSNKPIISR